MLVVALQHGRWLLVSRPFNMYSEVYHRVSLASASCVSKCSRHVSMCRHEGCGGAHEGER